MSSLSCRSDSCFLLHDVGLALSDLALSFQASAEALRSEVWLFFPVVAGLVGAVLASFFGVVVDRLPAIRGWARHEEEAIGGGDDLTLSRPGSHCPSCKRRLRFLELVPVLGYLWVQGKCLGCGSIIPIRYPVLEFLLAAASFAVVSRFGASADAALVLLLLWWLSLVAWLDWECHEIPDCLTFPLLFLGLLLSPFGEDMTSRLIATGLMAGIFLLVFRMVSQVRSVDANSYGDVSLAAVAGAWCGIGGVVPLVLLSSVLHIVYAIPMRRWGKEWAPMGPAISLATILVVVLDLRF